MLSLSKRKLLGTSMVAAGTLFSRFGLAKAQAMTARGRLLLDGYRDKPQGLVEACSFPLIEAIHGRRSRRFAKGAAIPSGPLAFTSRNAPEPLTEAGANALGLDDCWQYGLGRALRASS